MVNTTTKVDRRRPAEPINKRHARLNDATAGCRSAYVSAGSWCDSGPTCGGRSQRASSSAPRWLVRAVHVRMSFRRLL
jgi:hypothetical protein